MHLCSAFNHLRICGKHRVLFTTKIPHWGFFFLKKYYDAKEIKPSYFSNPARSENMAIGTEGNGSPCGFKEVCNKNICSYSMMIKV